MPLEVSTETEIIDQVLNEIAESRRHKDFRISAWQKNEDLYYKKTDKQPSTRANIDLARGQEFVHTLLSKIDEPLTFKFLKRKPAQTERVKMLNALKDYDNKRDIWAIKDIVGKKQAALYGRSINFYFATSEKEAGYMPHFEPIDVYTFLIDPNANGYDMESALYMGDYSVILSKEQLIAGAKAGIYKQETVDNISDSGGDRGEASTEEVNTENRKNTSEFNTNSVGSFRFWRWFTTFKGVRYYIILDESGNCVRLDPLTDFVSPTKKYPLAPWPYWSWAFYMDMTEFWTLAPMDYAREIFMAQAVSINQMVDNSEAINKPQKLVNTKLIKNKAQLKYKKDGNIFVDGVADVRAAIQFVQTPTIDNPITVYNVLEEIISKATAVTKDTSGVADADGKVGIYEGNQAAIAERFKLLNRSYSFGYERFAELWRIFLKDHLTQDISVDILGPNGVIVKEVSKKDLFKDEKDDYTVSVEASNADQNASTQDKKVKIIFLQSQAGNETQNQKKAYEMQAKIAGFTDEEVRELLDVEEFGSSKVMNECDRDIERLLDGETIRPNQLANNAYKQKMVNYLRDYTEDITDVQARAIFAYIDSLEDVIMRNTARDSQKEEMDREKLITEQLSGQLPEELNQPQKVNSSPL